MSIHIGDNTYSIAEAIIFFFLIASLLVVGFLFNRGEGNYSIKYELMRSRSFFLRNMTATYIIEFLYKLCFVLPFALMIAFAILGALEKPVDLAPLLINGLIVILMLYPTKPEHHYYKMGIIFVLAFGSQLATFFIYEKGDTQVYYVLSAIFYTANAIFFYLGLVALEGDYWEISEGVKKLS